MISTRAGEEGFHESVMPEKVEGKIDGPEGTAIRTMAEVPPSALIGFRRAEGQAGKAWDAFAEKEGYSSSRTTLKSSEGDSAYFRFAISTRPWWLDSFRVDFRRSARPPRRSLVPFSTL